MTVDDVFPQLTAEIFAEIDRQGYALLAKRGYKVEGAERDERVAAAIRRRMKRRGERFDFDAEMRDEGIRFVCRLYRGHRLLDETRGVYVKFGQGLGDGGESYGEEDRADQAGAASSP